MYSYNEILLSKKKKWAPDMCKNKSESQKHYAWVKRPFTEVNVYWGNDILSFYWANVYYTSYLGLFLMNMN